MDDNILLLALMVVTTTSMFPIMLSASASVSGILFFSHTILCGQHLAQQTYPHECDEYVCTHASKEGMKLFLLFFTALVAEAAKQKCK